jgi:hypothetical protein
MLISISSSAFDSGLLVALLAFVGVAFVSKSLGGDRLACSLIARNVAGVSGGLGVGGMPSGVGSCGVVEHRRCVLGKVGLT